MVIGGINVDFIAKGKEKGLRVTFQKCDYEFHQHQSCESDGCNGLLCFLVWTDQPRKCVSVIWRCRSKHCRYVMSYSWWVICIFLPAVWISLSHPRCLGAVGPDSLSRLGCRPLLISATGADSHSDAVFNYCKHMVSRHQSWGSLKTSFVSTCLLTFSCCFSARTRAAWPDCESKARLRTVSSSPRAGRWASDWETWTFISKSQRNMYVLIWNRYVLICQSFMDKTGNGIHPFPTYCLLLHLHAPD